MSKLYFYAMYDDQPDEPVSRIPFSKMGYECRMMKDGEKYVDDDGEQEVDGECGIIVYELTKIESK